MMLRDLEAGLLGVDDEVVERVVEAVDRAAIEIERSLSTLPSGGIEEGRRLAAGIVPGARPMTLREASEMIAVHDLLKVLRDEGYLARDEGRGAR